MRNIATIATAAAILLSTGFASAAPAPTSRDPSEGTIASGDAPVLMASMTALFKENARRKAKCADILVKLDEQAKRPPKAAAKRIAQLKAQYQQARCDR